MNITFDDARIILASILCIMCSGILGLAVYTIKDHYATKRMCKRTQRRIAETNRILSRHTH